MLERLQVDRGDGRPLYRQIVDGVAAEIRVGSLPAGARLPTVRELALRLDVTRPTVHKAFRELRLAGLVEATVGRGTFVRRASLVPAVDASPARTLTPDRIMEDIQRHGRGGDLLALAHAEPEAGLFPAHEFWQCLQGLEPLATGLLQYVSTEGDPVLRDELVKHAARRGISTSADEIIVTNGVTQGLSLVARSLCRPGDRVAVEEPTYLGLLQILEANGLVPVGIPLDEEGPRLDVLERVIVQDRPRFFYTIPCFHNPTGQSMSLARRRALIELAERHGMFIAEDDIYHSLAYDGPPAPTLKSLDRSGLVIYLDGMSKAGMPGLRSGYLVSPPAFRHRLLSMRRAADLCGSAILQRALAEFLRRGGFDRAMETALPVYRSRRDAFLVAMAEFLPPVVTWTEPQGGYCSWVTLPSYDGGFYEKALAAGVLIAPGEVFLSAPDPGKTHFRVCFGNIAESGIREAVMRLARVIERRLFGADTVAPTASSWTPLV